MWRTHKAAGRPWPKLSDDDVLDYMVMEAVALKANKEDREREKEQEKKKFKKDFSGLDQYR